MTPEERAEIIVRIIDREAVRKGPGFDPTATIASAIREAVEAEREACAQIADARGETAEQYFELSSFSRGRIYCADFIAAAIRRRGEE